MIEHEKEVEKLVEEGKAEKAQSGYPRCPACHMEIQPDASACPHCGRDLTT